MLSDGTLELSEEVASKFYTCTTCMHCRNACPSRIDVPSIVRSVRCELYRKGLAPEPIRAVVKSIETFRNPLGQPAEKRMEVFPKETRRKKQDGAYAGGSVLLWLGCVPSYADMKMVPSAIRIMEAAGEDYFFLGEDEGCCGYFVYLAGDEAFPDMARQNIERLGKSGAKKLVTPCAGCYRTFKSLYRELGGLGMEVQHMVEYASEMVEKKRLHLKDGLGKKVVYHDPCDLGRHMNLYDPPRSIIRKIAGDHLVEFRRNRENAACCGGGGGLAAADNGLSLAVSDSRIREAAGLEAELLVSACAGCKANLKKSAARVRKELSAPLKVMDITELIASALEG
jgi:Fe-S oxidoreductase